MNKTDSSVSEVTAVKTVEAAQRLSVTPKTIRELVRRGLLKPNRATRHLLFPVAELERFLQS
jgi:excisionase family DNA binding protein